MVGVIDAPGIDYPIIQSAISLEHVYFSRHHALNIT
jgi:hypothetical protein